MPQGGYPIPPAELVVGPFGGELPGNLICYLTFGHRLNKKRNKCVFPVVNCTELLKKEQNFESDLNLLRGAFYSRKEIDEFKGIVIIVHGYGNFYEDYLVEINFFAKNEYLVYAYDGTGCGESEGKNLGGYPQWIIDLKFAIEMVESIKEYSLIPIFLFGHSIGGFAATAVLNMHPNRVKGVVACFPINSGKEYARLLYNSIPCFFTRRILNKFTPLYNFFEE